ncbi:TRAP transporter small permease [Pseudovibrio exalbescens]|uniref:TRAP transporter small permease protein n=1 Tax=Pseudovibrio exalbescens TaxID=197461 RepID=A0A1U7JGH3_9HYPH|nr:TRAP transporter small permease [Pseudovibrio exalbescens]OKL43798.1 C4-dicarboxylate ABC transporter permease [Pseudovibrio exalbescens]
MLANTIKKYIDRTLATFSVLVMVLLLVCVVWQVFSRYVLNAPSTFTDEVARFSMIWVGLLGAAYCVGAQKHLSIDLFTAALSGRSRALCTIYTNCIVCAFAASAMVFGGARLVHKIYVTGQVSPAMQLPMEYVYAVLPLSGLFIVVYSLNYAVSGLGDFRKNRKEAC